MPTLANLQGSSLVSQFGAPIAGGIDRLQGRRREAVAQTELEDAARGGLNLPQLQREEQPQGEGLLARLQQSLGQGGDTALPEQRPQQEGGLLGRLSPGLARAINSARGNPEQEGQLREQVDSGAALSAELQALPNHAARVRRLAQEGGNLSARGEDIGRVTALSNLPPDQLDLELRKRQMIGKGAQQQSPAPDQLGSIAAVMARNPQLGAGLLQRRDKQIEAERRRRAAAANAAAAARRPQTPLGKKIAAIRHDIETGDVREDIGLQQIEIARASSVTDPGVEAGIDLDQKRANLAETIADTAATVAGDPIAVQTARDNLDAAGVDPNSQIYKDVLRAAAGVTAPPTEAEVAAATADLESVQANTAQTVTETEDLIADRTAPPEDVKAPKTIKQTRADGSEITLQWTPDSGFPEGGSWTPLATSGDASGTVITSSTDLTEGQAKMTLFKSMMEETQPVLSEIETQWNPANISDSVSRSAPILGNFFTSEEGQIYNSASSAWAEGALRLATGAAAPPQEVDRIQKTYFAAPGDTPTVIGFKSDMRDMYSRSIQRALGEGDVQGTLQTPQQFAADLKSSITVPVTVTATSPPGVDIGPTDAADGTTAKSKATGKTIVAKDGRWVTQ